MAILRSFRPSAEQLSFFSAHFSLRGQPGGRGEEGRVSRPADSGALGLVSAAEQLLPIFLPRALGFLVQAAPANGRPVSQSHNHARQGCKRGSRGSFQGPGPSGDTFGQLIIQKYSTPTRPYHVVRLLSRIFVHYDEQMTSIDNIGWHFNAPLIHRSTILFSLALIVS